MAFTSSDSITGKIFIPEKPADDLKKHICKDCFSCQMCSESRCQLCRAEKGRATEDQTDVKGSL